MDYDLSIIIISWNTKRLLAECLESLEANLKAEVKYEIILIDNASSDGSAEMVHDRFPRVRLIRNEKNIGFVKANNQGAEYAKGRYILLLNSDTLVLNGEINKIIKYMDLNKSVGIATGIVLNADGTFQYPFRRFPSMVREILRHTVYNVVSLDTVYDRRFRYMNLNLERENSVDWVSGAYMFIRREILENCEIFDKNVYMWYEDTLLCYKVRNQGYDIKYLPCAPIIHYGGMSSRQILAKSMFNSFNSSIVYIEQVYGSFFVQPYRKTVLSIWYILGFTFSLLSFLPVPKIRKKAKQFRTLLKLSSSLKHRKDKD